MSKPQAPEKPPVPRKAGTPKNARQEKLAKALRANLLRRKGPASSPDKK